MARWQREGKDSTQKMSRRQVWDMVQEEKARQVNFGKVSLEWVL